jgi:hypothetical protein
LAFSANSGQLEAGSTTTGSSFLPSTPPLALISSMAISATSFSTVSEMAMVPDSECRTPTLMVSAAHEVFVQAHGVAAKTFPSRFPLLCLDRIYVRNASVHLPVVLPRKPWSHLSDHAPLVAEIHL